MIIRLNYTLKIEFSQIFHGFLNIFEIQKKIHNFDLIIWFGADRAIEDDAFRSVMGGPFVKVQLYFSIILLILVFFFINYACIGISAFSKFFSLLD